MEEPSSVSVSDDMFVDGLPVETFTEFDVNMDQVVEIDTEGESTVGVESEDQVAIPDDVAAETVVMTTQQLSQAGANCLQVLKTGCSDEALAAQITGTSVLTTSGRYDVHYTPLVALSPESEEKLLVSDSELRHLKQDDDEKVDNQVLHKRFMDRLKKRKLRADPAFREKEKEEAKGRMRALRADPAYRKREREKDRLRRRLARQKNVDQKVKNKLKMKDETHVLNQAVDSSLLQIGADRRVMMGMPMLGMDVKGSETDTQRRRPTQIVTSVNNNRRVPKQLQSSKVVPQLNQTVAVANDNSKLPQTVSVANSNNQLLQTVSVAKDNKQSYGTVLVASDNSVTVTGSLTSGSQNAVLTSGSKGFPVRRFVITYDPNQVKYSLNTKRVPP